MASRRSVRVSRIARFLVVVGWITISCAAVGSMSGVALRFPVGIWYDVRNPAASEAAWWRLYSGGGSLIVDVGWDWRTDQHSDLSQRRIYFPVNRHIRTFGRFFPLDVTFARDTSTNRSSMQFSAALPWPVIGVMGLAFLLSAGTIRRRSIRGFPVSAQEKEAK